MVEKLLDRIGKTGAGMMVAGLFMTQFVFVVDGGERALVMDGFKGLRPHVYGEGMHFKRPWVD